MDTDVVWYDTSCGDYVVINNLSGIRPCEGCILKSTSSGKFARTRLHLAADILREDRL